MAIAQNKQDNLFNALSLFIEALRPYIVSLYHQEYGDTWPGAIFESLSPALKDSWNMKIKQGATPESNIDYQFLKSISIGGKDLFRKDFGRDINKLPTNLEEICAVRNKVAHFDQVEEDEFSLAFIQMKKIADAIGMSELSQELNLLQAGATESAVPSKNIELNNSSTAAKGKVKNYGEVAAWFNSVIPHYDIRMGKLDESLFAADLNEVAQGFGREIYTNHVNFFTKTYFTSGLKNVARKVITSLNGNDESENRVIALQTGFGGGKTHTLISLHHITKLGSRLSNTESARELIQYTGTPTFDNANIAVFTNKTNDPSNGRSVAEGFTIRTIWGEVAYQLGGVEAFEIVRKNDENLSAPAGIFKAVLEKTKPALILIDELADYCVKASAIKAGASSLADQTISFMQELTEAVAATPNCVVVTTLPASPQEVGNTPEAQNLLISLQKRVGRIGQDTQPVADEEIYEVIRRRLFEKVGSLDDIEAVASKYMEYYRTNIDQLPSDATKITYKERLVKSYPFHPEIVDVFRTRWASHHDFQRTRGALRLLASIVSDLWQRRQSLIGPNYLIHNGDFNLINIDPITAQLKRLYGNGYDAVISADVAGHASNAFKIDEAKHLYGQHHLSQSIATVILLNSFGADGNNKGTSIPELKLNLIRPDSFNQNDINGALTEFEGSAHYLHFSNIGGNVRRYWFHTQPNINILINQAKADIAPDDVDAEVSSRITDKIKNVTALSVLFNRGDDVAEQQRPTLVILHPKYQANVSTINGQVKPLIEKISTKKGNSERVYRNTLLFLVCNEQGYGRVTSSITEHLACKRILAEYSSQISDEQRKDIISKRDTASRDIDSSIVAAYSIIAKYSFKEGVEKIIVNKFKDTIDTQIGSNIIDLLKEEEWLLNSIGLSLLSRHNLLPKVGQPVKTKDIYEAFLKYDDKPMIASPAAITESLLRYCAEMNFCIASGQPCNFTKYYLGERPPFFDATMDDYWLVDKSEKTAPVVEQPTQPAVAVQPSSSSQYPTVDNTVLSKQIINENPEEIIKALIISGKVPLENYSQIFQSFLNPLKFNNLEIEITIKAKTTQAYPITDSSQVYKSVKESAKQLGLNLDEEN